MTAVSIAPSHLDRVLLSVGAPGKYHLLVAFLLSCMQLPVSFSDHLLTFYMATPRHRCRAESNLTLGDYDLRPIITVAGKQQYSACELYADPLDHSKGTKTCDDGWEFLMPKGESTVVTEWELVCEYESLSVLLPYMRTVAGMIGALVSGRLADKYGRKYVLLLSLLFHTSFGIFLHFLPLYGVFSAVFTMQAFLISGVQCSSYLLLLENLPTQWQSIAAFSVAMFHASGDIILSTLTWLIRHWRYIQLVLSAPGVIVIGYFWLLPRSLAWLVVENRHQSAQLQLSRFNSKGSFGQRIQLLKSCKVARSMPGGYAARHGFETIICSARLRLLAFTQYYIWFVVSLVSKCEIENVPLLKDNPYSTLFVNGVMEISFIILIFLALNSIGLKLTQGTTLSVCGICCIFSAVINHQIIQMHPRAVADRGLHHFAPLFGMLGKSIANACGILLWLHVVKTFPTGVRGLGLGSCMLCSKIASLFVPHLSEMKTHSQFIVLAFSGALCIAGGLLTYTLLPDCTNRPLATIAEEVEIGRTKIINDSDLQDEEEAGCVLAIQDETICRRISNLFYKKPPFLPKTLDDEGRGDIFEPVTGFIFKWDADCPVKINDLEKKHSAFWNNNETFEKKMNNTLNMLYNISEDNVEFQNNTPSDSSL
ncbi:organic anion transporter 3-like [Parasteatoda tepidariorum]|uniref:organic anion transporter 3-like n=1 Tax=Parasteatoda tepidariorum TaxID=114398 RepID=UPI00077FB438|nr:solute carrier family 22 member 8-like [Parasteatoda tepidariorum]